MRFLAPARLFPAGAALAGTLLFASAAPVQAADTPAAASAQARQEAQSERPVCKRVSQSGSRVSRRVCRTQAEWDREREANAPDLERPAAERSNY